MPPTVCLIRHGEALHNVQRRWHLADPGLSEDGAHQCRDLGDHLRHNLPWVEKTQLIVCSPMRRTIETAQIALDWLIQRGVPLVLRAEWQEMSDKACDTGSDVETLSQEYPDVDFSTVDPLYPSKTGLYAYTRRDMRRRGREARAWLKCRTESYIIVVTHSAFLRTSVANRRFANGDYRVFEFNDKPEDLELTETALTSGHGGMGYSMAGHMGIEEGDFPDEDGGDEKYKGSGAVQN